MTGDQFEAVREAVNLLTDNLSDMTNLCQGHGEEVKWVMRHEHGRTDLADRLDGVRFSLEVKDGDIHVIGQTGVEGFIFSDGTARRAAPL